MVKPLLSGFVLLLAFGCNRPCHELCAQNAIYVDNCLEYWEAIWPDMGFDDAEAYQASCVARVESAFRNVDIADQREMRLSCSEDLSAVAVSASCLDYLPNDIDFDPTEGDNGIAPQPTPASGR